MINLNDYHIQKEYHKSTLAETVTFLEGTNKLKLDAND
jgi:hypothetical protein